jgi:SNF2 family DNA or RNA helicase
MKITKRFVDEKWHEKYGFLKLNEVIFIAVCSYAEKSMVDKTGAGFSFWYENKIWWTNDINRAAKLSEHADPSCAEELDSVRKNNFQSLQASHAATTTTEFPHPEGLDYYPFQKAGIEYGLSRAGTLIGDDMGLGKTIQAIGLINASPDIKTVLVICPASLKTNWKREMQRWLIRPMKIGIGEAKCCPMPEHGYNVTIINYDIVKRLPQLKSITWDFLILDEVHRLKSYKAQRTFFIYGGKEHKEAKHTPGIQYKKCFALTGTPICNRPSELFPTLSFLDPSWKSRWGYFMKRYCGMSYSKYGCDTSGASNLEELQEVLRRSVMIRRLKSQVLTELPAKTRQIIELEPDENALSVIGAELESSKKSEAIYEEMKARVELAKAGSDAAYKEAVDNLRQAMSASFADISRLRHETSVAKIPAAIEYIKEKLEEVNKIVIFAHHKDVVAAICNEFPLESVHLTGDDSQEDRQIAVDSFQGNDKIKLFVGSIAAAGVGLTLTAASLVLFIELDWVPGNVTQAEDRCHRIGQKDAVTIQHLIFNGSLDSKMAKTLIEKQEIIDKALDIEPSNEPVHTSAPSTNSLNRQKIEAEALTITREEIIEIHSKLKILAAMDGDYANSINGVGFNKIDTNIGHSLADCTTLTAKQAVLGKRIVHKYRRQLEG